MPPPLPGASAGPVGCQAPAPSQPKSLALRDRGAGAAGAAGLLVAGAGAGCRLRSREHAALAGPRTSSAGAGPGEGESRTHPLAAPSPTRVAPSLLPCSPEALAGHDLGVPEAELCTPPRAGHPLSHHGTPLVSPERWGIGLHPDLGKCLYSAFLS